MKIAQKSFVLTAVVIAIIIIVTGFIIDSKGYLSNILAELTGLIIGVLVALLLVDRLTEYQRAKRWEKVRKLTHQAIASHLTELMIEVFTYFPIQNQHIMSALIAGRIKPNSDMINAITDSINKLREIPSQEKSNSDTAVECYNTIKWNINQIRHELITRVLQSSDDQELIDALFEFDEIAQELQNAVIIHRKIKTYPVFTYIITLLEKAQAILLVMVKKCE